MNREPRDPALVLLEENACSIVGNDWQTRVDKIFLDNLGKFRKYDGRSVQDLLRALRNKVWNTLLYVTTVKRALETSLSGFAGKCEKTSRCYARRISCVFHSQISWTVSACPFRRQQYGLAD